MTMEGLNHIAGAVVERNALSLPTSKIMADLS